MIKIFNGKSDTQFQEIDLSYILDEYKFEENIWIIMEKPSEEEEKIIFEKFNIHSLAVEDSRRGKYIEENGENQHSPKVEDYENFLFVIFHKIEPVNHTVKFRQKQLNAFIGKNWLITLTYENIDTFDEVCQILRINPSFFKNGPDFIFHLILDDIVDKTVPYLESIEDSVDSIEVEIFNNPTQSTLNEILQLKKILNRFRRIIFYQKEILYRLTRGEFSLISKEESIYYRDVYDHLLRALDLTESFRDNMISMVDAYLSSVSNKLNVIMKILTIITTIMMPLTFIAGIYGMNFHYMPELEWKFGYPLVLIIMLVLAVAMVYLFKRKKWF